MESGVQGWLERWMRQRVTLVTSVPSDADDDYLVAHLGDTKTRAEDCYWLLMSRGMSAVPAVRRGLRSHDAKIRYQCCRMLDHWLDDGVLADLVQMLDEDDPAVLIQVLHTLTCERCKEGACRPDAAVVMNGAIKLAQNHPSPKVRAYALEVVGTAVHDSPLAAAIVENVLRQDPDPAVRKKATWYAPGGPIHRRSAPA